MEFIIDKVSDDKKKPCKNAIPKILDCESLAWSIKLKNLNDLIELLKEINEPLIIYNKSMAKDSDNNNIYLIRVYDDRME